MNSNNEFDELARQKLAERSFTFEEGHWLAAQQALQAQRGGNKRGFWLLGSLALLLAGGGVWWSMQDEAIVEKGLVAAVEQEQEKTKGVAEGINTVLLSTTTAQDLAEETTRAQVTEQPGSTAENKTESKHSSRSVGPVATPAKHVGTVQGSTPSGTRTTQATRDGIASQAAASSTDPEASSMPDPMAGERDAPALGTVAEDPHAQPDRINTSLHVLPQGSSLDSSQLPVATVSLAEEPEVQRHDEIAAAEPASAQRVDPLDPNESTSSEVPDTATEVDYASTAELPKDSADALEPQLLELPLIAQRSPWEIGVMAGIFSTSSSFRGANSADWNDAITRQRSASVGAEFMRMGSNFGVGFGVHYGTYAERIAVGEVNNTQIDIDRFWYLRPVDTAIFVITDTLFQGGSPYYTGESVNTTINVLTQGFDTTTTITQRRTARELYNRVSYVEVPLLLDVHLVQGRWSLGLRGGPTLGLLAGRRGSLPNGSNDGYTEFSDQAFRELMVGYTARAYIRYRWNAAWSVGLEPAIRGQLMNSLADGPLERRSSAFGGMISLSYRLR